MGGSGSKEAVTKKLEGDAVAHLLGEETKSKVSSIPETIFLEYEHLEELDLDGLSCLKALPDAIGTLRDLHTLQLRECQMLERVPDSIGDLRALSTLNVTSCTALTELPPRTSDLVSLNSLDLTFCRGLRTLPAEIGGLVRLQQLKLTQCSALADIPCSIGRCTALRSLSLYGCSALTSLPEEMGQLPALQELTLRGCSGITSLPPSLGRGLPSLVHLDLTLCKGLAALPDSMGELRALQTLYLGRCVRLTALPPTILQLTALLTLQLYGCVALTALPEPIERLESLRALSCQGCAALLRLPDGLVRCPCLTTLTLWGCDGLQTLPDLSHAPRLAQWTIEGCPDHVATSEWAAAQRRALWERRTSAVHAACEAGNLRTVRALVGESGVDVEAKDEAGLSPLHDACYHGHLDIVRYLVGEKGADILARGYGGWYEVLYGGATPLRYACERDHAEIVLYLVEERGARLDMTDEEECLPLLWACSHGQLQLVQSLVGAHERRSAESEGGVEARDAWQNALDSACRHGLRHLEVVRYLVGEKGARVDVDEARRLNWLVCWTSLTFDDLHGFPQWEVPLHDVLQAAFPELQSIFLHYCGASGQSSKSMGEAAKMGLAAMLTIAKDTDLCTQELKAEELTRHFASAHAEAPTTLAEHRHPTGARDSLTSESSARSAVARTARAAKKAATADVQLNLFEFINFLVRVAFWRANPQWGSKSNRRDLTLVPEAVRLLLDECLLPKAERDTSGATSQELQRVASIYEAHGLSPFHSQTFLSKVLAGN